MNDQYRRDILEVFADGSGWEVLLICGHRVYCAVDPGKSMYCSECLMRDVDRAK